MNPALTLELTSPDSLCLRAGVLQDLLGPLTLRLLLRDPARKPLEIVAQSLKRCPSPDGLSERFVSDDSSGLTLELILEPVPHGLRLTPVLTLSAAAALAFVEVDAFLLRGVPEASSFLSGVGIAPGWGFFPLAYNSFSPAFVRDSRAMLPKPRFYTAGTFNQHTQSPYWGSWSDLSSAWMAALRHVRGPETLLLGWEAARTGLGEIALRRRSPTQVEARLSLDFRLLDRGETLTLDPLLILFDADGEALVRAHAQQVASRMNARVPSGPVATGWCSWYYYYTDISEKTLAGNVQELKRRADSLPLTCIQLDDGYQTAVGDWLSVNNKFPGGLEAVAQSIRDAGFVAGIWTAPFMIQRSSQVFRTHPDWLMKAADGSLQDFGYHPIWGVTGGQVYCLDPTHPEVQVHLRTVYQSLRAMGYTYFKIDFLNAGLQAGLRFDRKCSSVEAFRLGLALIREAIGPDAFLLGCGAPLLPCVGVVDAMRISSDVKEAWDDPVLGFISNGNGHPAAELAILNSMTRAHLHGVWWHNDPDCLLVRDTRSSLKVVEIQTLLTVLSLTGGMLLLSDDLTRLKPERLSLAELAFPALGAPARCVGLLEDARPRLFVRTHLGPLGTEALGARIHWGRSVEETTLGADDLGLPPGRYHAYEYWSDHWRVLEVGERFPLTLDPHECALLLLRPAQAHPQLISLSHHLGQTTTLLGDERWDDATRTLTLELRFPAHRQGRLWISLPVGYTPMGVDVSGALAVEGQTLQPGAVRFRLAAEGDGTLAFRFA